MIHLPDLTFASALLAGLISSGHCIAMCGAIALAGQTNAGRPEQQIAYHAGRLFSYTLIGALAGGSAGLILQQTCSEEVMAAWPRVAASLALIGIALATLLGWHGLERIGRPVMPLWRRMMPLAQRLRRRQDVPGRFILGTLWGWLPCGLVYAVAATAAISGSATTGALLLLGFGIGTLPALLGSTTLFHNGLRQFAGSHITRPVMAVSLLTMSLLQLASIQWLA